MSKEKENDRMEKIVSLAKRRGFVYQGSEIYGGLAGTWDYGPNGTALKNNVKNLWWKHFVNDRQDVYGVDAAILMNPKVWEASGHIDGFSDPMVECEKCKKRFRADHIEENTDCPVCNGTLSEAREFNLMFKTNIGAIKDNSSITYLRPETAGGIFVNFKNILDTFHPKLPFGIAQIGKAFRNEIAPRDFLFRQREFEQMELQYFIKEDEQDVQYKKWQESAWSWLESVGLSKEKMRWHEHTDDERAHYASAATDIEYNFPFGYEELHGIHNRGTFDLSAHIEKSGEELSYFDQESGKRFIPNVIEASLGLDRLVLAILSEAYTEEEVDGKTRVVMKFKSEVAPVKAAVLPLMRKEKLTKKALEVYDSLKSNQHTQYDETGSIGKRYRRQDEIGTPLCVTVDFDSLEDDSVTVRDRDSMKQNRVKIESLQDYIDKLLKK